MFFSTVASQYFVGSGSPTGHSINSVSSPRFAAPRVGAVRTRTRAKRERSLSFVPSRHVIVRQACFGRLSANCLALRRSSDAPRSDTLRTLSFFFQAEEGIRDVAVTGVQACALPI